MSDKIWEWRVFGNDILVGTFDKDKAPSLRVRLLSRIIMGSKWTKVDPELSAALINLPNR